MTKFFLSIAILFSLNASAQNLDTVVVRNLQMQAQDWAYLVGAWNTTVDSVSMVAYRKIRDKVQSILPNVGWNTNMTIDSLPGKVVMDFYNLVKTSGAGEVVTRYTAITNAITGKTNLAYWIGRMDEAVSSDYLRKRDRGKNLLID